MGKAYIKIDTADNTDGNQMFNRICEKVLKIKKEEGKELLGIPKKEDATTQDAITLLQNSITDGMDIKVEIIVTYEEITSIEDDFTV